MFNHEIFAVSFARAIVLMGAAPPDPAQQKAALRAVHALTSLAAAAVRVYDGALAIDDVGIADDLPSVAVLVERMQAHGLAEITIARSAPPADLLVLLRALAAEPERMFDAASVKRRLGKASAASIVVLPLKGLEAASGRRSATVSQAFELDALEVATADSAEEPPPPPALSQVDSAPDLPEVRDAAWLTPVRIPVESQLGAALQAVTLDPYGEQILDRLANLGRAIAKAFASDQVELAAQALAAVVSLESGAPEGTPRSSYAITLLRALTHDTLAQLAPLALDQRFAPVATTVLQRGGGDAVEILLGLLATAQSMRERKAFMTLLRGMRSGTDRALDMLYHGEWFVVRNVAELVGELRMEEAVPRLAELLGHQDARVARTAAAALAKVGSAATVEPLRRVLREGTPELRAFVASGIGGARARALAMPLVALADEESEPLVLAELYRALGRIGTSEAVRALIKAAQTTGSLLRRRPSPLRVAAVEGLQLAGGAAAVQALEALRKDGDKAVRAAAEKALAAAS